jgi:hypothetical protein
LFFIIYRKLGEGAFGTVCGGECFFDEKGWVSYSLAKLEPHHFSVDQNGTQTKSGSGTYCIYCDSNVSKILQQKKDLKYWILRLFNLNLMACWFNRVGIHRHKKLFCESNR